MSKGIHQAAEVEQRREAEPGDDRNTGGGGVDDGAGHIRGGGQDDGFNHVAGTKGDDRFDGTSGNDDVSGDAGNDRLAGGLGDDRLNGGIGDDRLDGGDGNDTLVGDLGNDRLDGGAGNDSLYGGAGYDELTGGLGSDSFVFKATTETTVSDKGSDLIRDFSHAQHDHIDLQLIDANTLVAGDQGFSFVGDHAFSKKAGELQAVFKGGDTLVSGDVNGDGKADFSVTVKGHITLHADDFLL